MRMLIWKPKNLAFLLLLLAGLLGLGACAREPAQPNAEESQFYTVEDAAVKEALPLLEAAIDQKLNRMKYLGVPGEATEFAIHVYLPKNLSKDQPLQLSVTSTRTRSEHYLIRDGRVYIAQLISDDEKYEAVADVGNSEQYDEAAELIFDWGAPAVKPTVTDFPEKQALLEKLAQQARTNAKAAMDTDAGQDEEVWLWQDFNSWELPMYLTRYHQRQWGEGTPAVAQGTFYSGFVYAPSAPEGWRGAYDFLPKEDCGSVEPILDLPTEVAEGLISESREISAS